MRGNVPSRRAARSIDTRRKVRFSRPLNNNDFASLLVFFYTCADLSKTARVGVIDRIVTDIGIQVDLIAIPHRIDLQKPPGRRRVETGLVIPQPDCARPVCPV